MKNIEINHVNREKPKFQKDISPQAKENQRPFGSIQIDIPESVRRNSINHAFVSIDSSIVNQEDDLNAKFSEIIELENNFKLTIFLEFLLYHFLFFFFIGPFLPVVCYPIFRNFTRFKNMCFWGINKEFLTQVFLYFFSFGALFGYFFLNSPNIYPMEIISLLNGGFLRICVIAIKYAHLSDRKLFHLKNTVLSWEEIRSEFTYSWSQQDNFVIDKELYTCLLKNDVDSSIFRIYFLKPLRPSLSAKLSVPEKELESSGSVNTGKDSLNNTWLNELWGKSLDIIKKNLYKKQFEEEGGYSGYLVARFLVKANKGLCLSLNTILYFTLPWAFIYSLMPSFYRYRSAGTFFGSNAAEIIVIMSLFFGNVYYAYLNIFMLIIGVVEYDRPIHLLSQLSNILSPKKVNEYYERKILPTVNIFCPYSYKSWYSLNKIFRSYGEKILKRIEMILGLFLFCNIVFMLLNLMAIFGLISLIQDSINLAFSSVILIITFILIFTALYKGAIINEFYDIHRDLLKCNKDVITDLIHMYDIYFEKEESGMDHEIYYYGVALLTKFYKGRELEPLEKKRMIIAHLNTLKEMSDEIIEQLAFSKERRPFKIFGIPTTKALIKSILAGLGTLLIAGLQKILAQK